jgi:hypothetical protein
MIIAADPGLESACAVIDDSGDLIACFDLPVTDKQRASTPPPSPSPVDPRAHADCVRHRRIGRRAPYPGGRDVRVRLRLWNGAWRCWRIGAAAPPGSANQVEAVV